MQWHGRSVVVTGASAGVGRAIVRAFGARGARVALLARTREALEVAAEEVRSLGGEALVFPLDVADAAAVEEAAALVVAEWGGIDVWVNDAMVSVFSPIRQMTAHEYRRVTEVNYLGYVHGTLAALRHMRARDAGTIVQIGSALAYRSIPLQSAYCASKAAIRAFTDSLRSELIHEGSRIRVTHVHLPAVNTPQFEVVRNRLGRHAYPVPPVYQPELIAEAVVRAAWRAPREVILGWPTRKAVLAQKLVPGFADWYLAHHAWDAQTTDALPPTTRDDLDAPLPGDRGAHGPFDDSSRGRSLWMSAQVRGLPFWLGTFAGAALASRALRR